MPDIPKLMKALGPSPNAAFILFIDQWAPIGVSAITEKTGISYGAVYRMVGDLEPLGIIERDVSRQIPGKPYKLTVKGKKVAALLRDIESLL